MSVQYFSKKGTQNRHKIVSYPISDNKFSEKLSVVIDAKMYPAHAQFSFINFSKFRRH